LQVANAYLKTKLDSELVTLIIDIFEDHEAGNAIRKQAYINLAELAGASRDQILDIVLSEFDLEKDVDSKVIENAKEIADQKIVDRSYH